MLEWLDDYVAKRGLKPLTSSSGHTPPAESKQAYLTMFYTAIEMALSADAEDS